MKKRKGQSVVEFALVLPLFLLIMFGVIYTGMLFHDYITVSNIARTSAREAAVTAKDEYGAIATHYEGQLNELLTNFYKKADSNPIVIVPEGVNGVQATINMQLNTRGYFVELILPPSFGVQYYMRKEPINPTL